MSREAWGDPPDIDWRAEAEAAQEARLVDHAYAEGRKDEREAIAEWNTRSHDVPSA